MSFTLDNFVRSILAVDATAGDTSLVLALAAPPARDPPAATADAPGILILQDAPAAPTKIEIVTYIGRSIVGTQVTLTGVTRGCEGTTAQSWTAGTPTFSGSTSGVLAQFATQAALAVVAASIPTTPGAIGAATSAQGQKADTAVQPAALASYALTASLATVATSGSYNDLGNKPALGTAAYQSTAAFATAAQGAKADSAVQPGALDVYAPLTNPAFNAQSESNYSITDTADAHADGVSLGGAFTTGGGGTVLFGVGSRNFAFIKGYFTNGSGNGLGNLVFGIRRATGNTTIDRAITLNSDGSVTFYGAITAPSITDTSDERFKSGVYPMSGGEKLDELRPVWFFNAKTMRTDFGFIAQEVREVYPEIVHEDADGYLSLAYQRLVAPLVAEVQSLRRRVAELEAKV